MFGNSGLRYEFGPCAMGQVLVATSASGIAAILLGNNREQLLAELQATFRTDELQAAYSHKSDALGAAIALVDNPALDLGVPLDMRGTVFQQTVWRALRQIPAGTTTTYRAIAQQIGAPKATRAVAAACAANRIAIAIPCHRVVRQDGTISGYRWGVDRKRRLLARERFATASGKLSGDGQAFTAEASAHFVSAT